MTDLVNTEALRATASDLRETGGWHPWRDDDEARENWLRIEAAADEVDRLRIVIEDAPHMDSCRMSYLSTYPNARCTCWKADVL